MKFHVRVSQNRLKIVFLSEGDPLAAVVRSLSGNPRWNWIEGDATSLDARLFEPRRALSSDKRRGTREGRIWRERPPLLVALVRHGGGESNFIPNFTLTPLPRGGRSLSSNPCGKAEMPIQEASASMPRDSSDWMPKASMTSAGASISSSGPCMSRAWAKSSSVSAVKIRAPMAATIRSSTDWG